MNIHLDYLSDSDKERFVDGFAEAAAIDFPHFDPDLDQMRLEPWSRPWENGPMTMVLQAAVCPAPEILGRQWFWIVREDMLREAACEILPHHQLYGADCQDLFRTGETR